MKTAQPIVIPFPLPCKIRAKTGKELKEKVSDLLPYHDAFFATEAIESNGVLTSFLRKY